MHRAWTRCLACLVTTVCGDQPQTRCSNSGSPVRMSRPIDYPQMVELEISRFELGYVRPFGASIAYFEENSHRIFTFCMDPTGQLRGSGPLDPPLLGQHMPLYSISKTGAKLICYFKLDPILPRVLCRLCSLKGTRSYSARPD